VGTGTEAGIFGNDDDEQRSGGRHKFVIIAMLPENNYS